MADIFKSPFTLILKYEEIEHAYQEIRNKSIKFINLIYTSITLIFSLVCYSIYTLTDSIKEDQIHLIEYIQKVSSFLVGIHTILFFLNINTNRIILHRWISYLNIFFFMLSNFTLRIYLINYESNDYLISSVIFIFQQFFLFSLFLSNALDFYEGFWIYLISEFSSHLIYAGIFDKTNHFRLALDGMAVIITSVMSYYYVYERRKSFFLKYTGKMRLKWFKNTIDTINCGFANIKKRRKYETTN